MHQVVDKLNAWSPAWAALAWAILWQSTAVIIVIAALAWLLRRSSPGVRYWLWQIAAIKLLLMPVWTVAIQLPALPEETRAVEAATTAVAMPERVSEPVPILRPGTGNAAEETGASLPPLAWWEEALSASRLGELSWQSWLLLGWAAVVVGQGARLLRQRFRLGVLLRQAAGPKNSELPALVKELAEGLGLRRVPAIRLTAVEVSPFVCGPWRPVLVLPQALLRSLDDNQRRQVLLHELAHVKRRDLVWGWLPVIARVLYFFHPLAHWVSYRIRLERELACDQLAMAVSGQTAADYAETLIRVVSHSSQPAVLKIAAGLNGDAGLQPPDAPSKETSV